MNFFLKTILIAVLAIISIFAQVYSIKKYTLDKDYIMQVDERCTSTVNIPKYKKLIWAISR